MSNSVVHREKRAFRAKQKEKEGRMIQMSHHRKYYLVRQRAPIIKHVESILPKEAVWAERKKKPWWGRFASWFQKMKRGNHREHPPGKRPPGKGG